MASAEYPAATVYCNGFPVTAGRDRGGWFCPHCLTRLSDPPGDHVAVPTDGHTSSAATIEWWLCGECLHIAPSHTWGIKNGNNDTAVCPGCGFAHHDDENSWIEAGTELEMRRRSSEAYREARDD